MSVDGRSNGPAEAFPLLPSPSLFPYELLNILIRAVVVLVVGSVVVITSPYLFFWEKAEEPRNQPQRTRRGMLAGLQYLRKG